jgi:hypothetical protein
MEHLESVNYAKFIFFNNLDINYGHSAHNFFFVFFFNVLFRGNVNE